MRRKHIWLIGAIMGGLTGVMFGCSQEQGFVESTIDREIYSETIEGCETMEVHETIAPPSQEPAKETEEKEPEIAEWETMSLEQLLQEKRYPAALAWIRARKSQEWDDLEVKLQERIAGDFIVAGDGYIAARKQNGSIVIAGKEGVFSGASQNDFDHLRIRSFVDGQHPGVITEEGKYLSLWRGPQEIRKNNDEIEKNANETGGNIGVWMSRENEGSQMIYEWNHIALMSVGYPESGMAVQEDGSVLHVGCVDMMFPERETADFEQWLKDAWTDIVDLEVEGAYFVAALRQDGTVLSKNYSGLEDWSGIVALESDNAGILYGLTAAGRVLCANQNERYDGIVSTEQMEDIIAITAACVYMEPKGRNHQIYGLRRDGVVVDHMGQPVEGFENIVAIDASENGWLIGLKADGTMIVSCEASWAAETGKWSDLYIPQW